MKANNTTGVKYLHKDYRDKYGNDYIVRCNICGKTFIVWRGNDFNLGKQVAEEVAWKMADSNASFVDWYDNERLDFLASIGTNDGSIKTKWHNIIGKKFGPHVITKIVKEGPTLRETEVEIKCTNCGNTKITLYKNVCMFKYTDTKKCRKCK